MRCLLAKRNSVETDLGVRGSTTASGLCAASHLSPEYRSRTDGSKVTSPRGRRRLSRARWLRLARIRNSQYRTADFQYPNIEQQEILGPAKTSRNTPPYETSSNKQVSALSRVSCF